MQPQIFRWNFWFLLGRTICVDSSLTKDLNMISDVFICYKIHKKVKATSQMNLCASVKILSPRLQDRHASLRNFQNNKKRKTNLQQFLTSVSPGVSLFPTFAPTFFCHHRALIRRENNRPKVVQDSGASARLSWVAAGEWMVMRHRPQSQRDVPVFDGTPSWGGVMSAAKVGLGGHTWHRLRASPSRLSNVR